MKNELRERFKNHSIDIKELDGVTIVDFNKQHRMWDRILFIFHEQNCYISGDYGEWVFECTWKPNIYNLPADNRPYFLEKLSRKCKKTDFDSQQCEKDIDEWYDEFDAEEETEEFMDELVEQLDDLKSETDNEYTYISQLYKFIDFMQDNGFDMCETGLYYAGQKLDGQLSVILYAIEIIQERLKG